MEAPKETSFPLEKHTLVRVIVILVCCLTMIGSLIVVFSYICIKSLRSEARHIVLHLSFMDFGTGLANLIGAAVNFDRYYQHGTVSNTVDSLCQAQAFVALFTTFSSVFWTMSLAVYMYIMVFHNFQRTTLFYLPLCYIICYGLPVAITVWLFLTNRLGNAPYNSSGWCGIILVDGEDENSVDVYAAVFGYDLWIYLTFFLCATMYSATFLRINVEFRSAAQLVGITRFWSHALQFLDYKLVLIPLAFFVLRIWSCIVNILFVYGASNPSSINHSVNLTLVILAGIGDSGQGMANGLIFVLLVKEVRQKMLSAITCKRYRNEKKIARITSPLLINSGGDPDERCVNDIGERMFTPTTSLLT